MSQPIQAVLDALEQDLRDIAQLEARHCKTADIIQRGHGLVLPAFNGLAGGVCAPAGRPTAQMRSGA